MGLTIIGCGLHFFAVKRIINTAIETRFDKILNTINVLGFSYGLLFTLVYFLLKEQLHLGQPLYLFSWYLNVTIILLMMFILSLSIFRAGKGLLNFGLGIFAGLWMFYFNAAGYFLNYEGVIHYYIITYPNYFYWGLSFEFIAFGFILAWRYRETFKKNLTLISQHSKHQAQLLEKEIEIQERERTQIARDLHDDLGTTISAIKLIISNSYSEDRNLMEMVNKASKDVRFFSSTFSAVDLKYGLFKTVKSRVQELNALGMVQFQFIGNGNENTIDADIKVSTFRMFSELSNNVLKHAKASKATIQIIIDEEQILIMIEDDGVGFDTNHKHDGIGLGNIQRRAARFNGNVHVMTDSRSGTTVIITIPKSSKNDKTL
jgi:signal transduction histidine kinase